MRLLISCTVRKSTEAGTAKEVYRGALFKKALVLAASQGFECLILSAKHGWITPETLITPYDTKFLTPYEGPWPSGSGYFLGGDLYFKHVPKRFKRLIPSSMYGEMLSYIAIITSDFSKRDELFHPAYKRVGVVAYIERLLLNGNKYTRPALIEKVCSKFNHPEEDAKRTVSNQTRQKRIGDERGLILLREKIENRVLFSAKRSKLYINKKEGIVMQELLSRLAEELKADIPNDLTTVPEVAAYLVEECDFLNEIAARILSNTK